MISPDEQSPIHLGQICEVQWLRQLKDRLQSHDSRMQLVETNFYLDDEGIQIVQQDNHFHLPEKRLATFLFQCYYRTVHMTFPMVPPELQAQLFQYYDLVEKGHVATNFSPKWYAIVNLVLLIGARFSRLTCANSHIDIVEESIYLTQAHHLLQLENMINAAASSDLSSIQVRNYFCLSLEGEVLTRAGQYATRFLLYGYWSHQQVSIITY
jgi:hypothetical protein